MNTSNNVPPGAAVTSPAPGDGARGGVGAAAAAGGVPTAVAVALATSGRPFLAAAIGGVGIVAAFVAAVVANPVGLTLAHGYVERRLLRAATAEARRTDDARAATAVALIEAVKRRGGRTDRR